MVPLTYWYIHCFVFVFFQKKSLFCFYVGQKDICFNANEALGCFTLRFFWFSWAFLGSSRAFIFIFFKFAWRLLRVCEESSLSFVWGLLRFLFFFCTILLWNLFLLACFRSVYILQGRIFCLWRNIIFFCYCVSAWFVSLMNCRSSSFPRLIFQLRSNICCDGGLSCSFLCFFVFP